MGMNLEQGQIRDIRDYFRDKPVVRAYLFGSRARDEGGRDSDIDILVELDYSRKIGLEFIGMKLDLEELLHGRVDLVSDGALSDRLRPAIDREKLLIYEKTH